MKHSIVILLTAILSLSNAISITSPAQGTTKLPVWPETLLEWTWGPGDPAALDIVIQFKLMNTDKVNNFTWKAAFPAEQRSVTIPWIPLGLDVGTECELGLTVAGNTDSLFNAVGPFALVKANSDALSASNYPPTIYTTTSASRTYTITSTIGPIETGVSAATTGQPTISTTTSSTITYTVTSTTANIDTITATMSSSGAAISSASPAMSTNTSSLMATAAASSSTAASSSLDISFTSTPYSHGASDVDGPTTVYVTVTETAPCGSAASSSATSSSSETSASSTVTVTATGIGASPSPPLVSPPPFPTTSSSNPITANTASGGSTLGITSTMTIPSTAPITMQTQTGSANSIYDTFSVKNATRVYIAGLTLLAYAGFMLGVGI